MFEILEATKNDINDIINIIDDRIVWMKENNINQWGFSYTKSFNYEYFVEQLNSENKLFIAKNDNIIVGVMLLKQSDLRYWKYDDGLSLYIHHLVAKHGETGIGLSLLHFAENFCINNGKQYLRLDCVRENKKLNDYYEMAGFKLKGCRSNWKL